MRNLILVGSAALVLGLGIGYMAGGTGTDGGMSNATSAEKEVLYWVAPMDANYRRDVAGKSPMGMDLVPVYAGAGADDSNALRISAAVVNNIGVRTAAATVSDLYTEIETVGMVGMDESLTSHVHVRTAGWVDKLYRKAVGEVVKKGEVIFELYSPELISAQSEFLQALRLKNSGLVSASEERLIVLGMSAMEISQLKKSRKVKERIDVRAPQDGVIMALSIGEGMHVKPGKTVFSLADLSSVWVNAEVFEAQSGLVSKGQSATMKLPFWPGVEWKGTVDYVYPTVDPRSRTTQVRLVFSNADGRLKPNMYADISLTTAPQIDAISIPREALIRTGKTDRVILALGDGLFKPAEVVAGIESGDRIEIIAGLSRGEKVVTSGQFLIDSEASLNGAFLRLLDEDTGDGMVMDMGSMDGGGDAEMDTETHHGMGIVVSLNADGTVTLEHEPIESLNWPVMTMDFAVADDIDLSVFSEGDRMHFMLQQTPAGGYVITTAMKM